jgi:hypothetical protein
MTIEELEIDRIERMIRVLSIDRSVKYSSSARIRDLEIIQELNDKLDLIRPEDEKRLA